MATYIADIHGEYDKYVESMKEYMSDYASARSGFNITPFTKWVQSRLAYGAQWTVSDDDFYDFDLVYRTSCP